MTNVKAVGKTYYGKIKSIFGIKTSYGKFFKEQDADYYQQIFDTNPMFVQDFTRFLKSKSDVRRVLEVGCGTGIFPIKYKDMFKDIEYTGFDISQKNIDYCKQNSKFKFICGDFLNIELDKKYDLVFSFNVIQHVYDIDLFVSKIAKTTTKYAYINSHRPYYSNLKEHKMEWRDDEGIFYNDISKEQIDKTLTRIGLLPEEFIMRAQPRNEKDGDGVVIEIIRKKSNNEKN